MPRLTNHEFIHRHGILRKLWKQHQHAFSYVSHAAQYDLHHFYVPSKRLPDEELIDHRRAISQHMPMLPNRASKHYHHFIRILAKKAPIPNTPGKGRITIAAVVKPEPNLDLLVNALMEMVDDSRDKEQI